MDILVKGIVSFIVLASIQGILLFFLLISNKIFNKPSNRYLALFILAFSLSNFHYAMHIVGLMETYDWLNYLTFPWTFLIPPVFYFFIVYLLDPEYKLSRREKYLFVPFIVQLVFHLFLFTLRYFNVPLSSQIGNVIHFLDTKVETVLSLLINLIFVPLVLIKLTKYEKNLRDNYSEISTSSITWLKNLVVGLVVIWGIWALPALYQIFTGITTPVLDLVLWVLMSISIYWIGYATYFRRDVFFAKNSFPSFQVDAKKLTQDFISIEKEQSLPQSEIPNRSYEPDLDSNSLQLHFDQMISLLEKEQLFRDENFSLSMLSKRCGLSANYVSQIINKKTKGNFYSLINNYRVEEVKDMIASSEFGHYTLVSIGIEAGFKSKSSFFKIFKDSTGLTPNQFKSQLDSDS